MMLLSVGAARLQETFSAQFFLSSYFKNKCYFEKLLQMGRMVETYHS